MLVCHCFRTYEDQIKKCENLNEVREKTRATLGCGSCLPLVKEILQKNSEPNIADLVQR